jgi:Metallo-peptidase family M12
MMYTRSMCAALVLASLVLFTTASALAQDEQDAVPLIMLKPQGATFSAPRLRKLYDAIKKRAGRTTNHVLPLTKTEVLFVPRDKVDAVRKAAARRGVVMNRLSATWRHVFHKAPANVKMSDKQTSMMEMAKSSKAVMGVGVMMAPPPPMVEYALTKDANTPSASNAEKIMVTLSESRSLSITRTSVEIKSNMCTWRGTVDGTDAPATLMWWPGGKMTGTVQHEGRIYSIRHMGGELHAVVEMGENLMPQEHAAMPQRIRANDPNLRDDPLVQQGDASTLRPRAAFLPDPKAAAKGGASPQDVVIDVIVAYTRKAASNYTDVKRELVDLSIEEANESFRQSGIGQVQLRLVHAYQTDYIEEGSHFDHVWRFADKGDGYMDEIHGLRNKYRADVAVLIVVDPQGCGLATRVYADAEEAFAVVHHECAATTYSVAHEIGHIIGARHDLNLDKIMTPFPFGHGFVNGTKWRDIMSYKESCGGCPRLPVWSGPKVLVRGEPAGTTELDNERVIAEQAARVAAFR